jgi:ABC-type polysaccharide/polyol phosphate export permease
MAFSFLSSIVTTPIRVIAELVTTLFQYREYLKQSVARDLRKAYKRSLLGYLWSMLNPLFMMLILTIVFSKIMRVQVEHYSVFLFAGMLPWQYFSQTVVGGLDSVRANRRIIEHLPIPKYVFILTLAFSNLANFSLSLVPLLGVMLFVGKSFSLSMLALPFIVLPLMLISVGAALFFATMNVFFQDTRHLVGVFLQALYYLTPIIYGLQHVPPSLAKWMRFNPMCYVVELMRKAFYYGEVPSMASFSVAFGISLLILIIGLGVFRKAESRFMYFI